MLGVQEAVLDLDNEVGEGIGKRGAEMEAYL